MGRQTRMSARINYCSNPYHDYYRQMVMNKERVYRLGSAIAVLNMAGSFWKGEEELLWEIQEKERKERKS